MIKEIRRGNTNNQETSGNEVKNEEENSADEKERYKKQSGEELGSKMSLDRGEDVTEMRTAFEGRM